jgi:hypothetical protein
MISPPMFSVRHRGDLKKYPSIYLKTMYFNRFIKSFYARVLMDIKSFYRTETLLFLIAFAYIFFFTSGVPPFWEEQVYQSDYVQESTLHWVKEIFFSFGKNNILDADRPFDALLFKGLFAVTGYNYMLMRFFKALLFGIFVVLLYSFVNKYVKNKTAACSVSLFIMFSFSLYIHTLVFAEPYLLTETLKLGIFLLFLKDYYSQKTSYHTQFVVGLLFLLSIRAYLPAYSTMGILFAFVLLDNWKRIKRYAFLFLFFLLSAFPYPFTTQIGGGMALVPNLWSIQHFFFTDVLYYVTTPMISFKTLYYKPLFALLTFFGFWLITIFFVLFCFRGYFIARFTKYTQPQPKPITLSMRLNIARQHKVPNNRCGRAYSQEHGKDDFFSGVNKRSAAIFFVVWLFAELPLWIVLPEHATRYATSILLPFCLLLTLMVMQVFSLVRKEYRRFFALFTLTLLFFALVTNLAYVTAFRAGWGSSFIAIEKTQDFIAQDKEGNTLALYFGQSVAEEYYAINKSSENHTLIADLHFKQLKNEDGFKEDLLFQYSEELVYETIYVIKRVTSGGNGLPDVDFDTYDSLELVAVLEGRNMADPFDFFLSSNIIEDLGYDPNYIFVYELHQK